jgi:hypothetical protein
MADSQPSRKEVRERTAKLVRRIGYVIFMGGGLLIFIPMLIGVGSGISNDRVWDPFTHKPLSTSEDSIDCSSEARRLLVQAGRETSLSARWDEPYRAWLTRCRDDNPELYDALQDTRDELIRQGTR